MRPEHESAFQPWADIDHIRDEVNRMPVSEPSSVDMRPFPMQGGPPIPWFLAEAIWTHLYRHDQPLEVMARRGGFGWAEVKWMWEHPQSRTTREHRARCDAEVRAALNAS